MIQSELFSSTPNREQRAITRRDKGIKKAVDHADAEMRHWREMALSALRRFLGDRGDRPFLTEAFRVRANVPDPPDARAWGGVMSAAKKEGLIVSVGFDRALTSNMSPKVLWKKKEE